MPLRKVEDFKRFEKQLDLPDIRNNLIAAIRAFGGDDIKSVTQRAWKETVADSLMSQFTWTGQLKKGSTKEMGLSLKNSSLAKTVIEAIKHDDFKDVTIKQLQEISKDFVRRAGDRLKAALKSQQKKGAGQQSLRGDGDGMSSDT
uniref:DUF4806 domain-containing protein n=1 Tax=Daphnia galeata TaxID=27404 RepID=A0A8J2RPF5_9CRUS|nr:unnamed protein product [Daphnia galeata]